MPSSSQFSVGNHPTHLDSQWVKPASYTWLDRQLLPLIRDERDLTIVYRALGLSALVMPLAALLYVFNGFPWWVGALYVGGLFTVLMSRYVLMLHCVSHRPLFKKQYGALNAYIPAALGLFFGQTPYSYYCHHMGMHHPENNLHHDLSSTLKYQRDSIFHFLAYTFDFLFLNIFKIPYYFWVHKRKKLLKYFLIGELGWYLGVLGLLVLAPWPTLWVFVLPMLLIRLFMMCGNWAQHAFVDATDPNNPYKNSVTLVESKHNAKCYNDGYHVVHHIHPAMHWSEMASECYQTLADYGKHRAIVFRGLDDFQSVWNLLMLKRYRTLANHMVDLPGLSLSTDQKIALLKQRLAPIPQTQANTTPAQARKHARAG